MKSLIAGIVLILLVGIGGFLYRNLSERGTGAPAVACTMEAKLCPDGSAVGRSGADCAFAACPFPNVSFPEQGISFALPDGYQRGVQEPGADGDVEELVAFFQKATDAGTQTISVYAFPIPNGKTANDTILASTIFSPSGESATSFDRFAPVFIDGRTFQSVTIERFEGQVTTAYYLARDHDIVRFDVSERGVDWTNPSLAIDELPEHQALLRMLTTLQTP